VVDAWTVAGAGPEAVEPIPRFMEAHPSIDYGVPGALVHFLAWIIRDFTGKKRKGALKD
jgi:hypothetical protein